MTTLRIDTVPPARWPRLAPFIRACNGDGATLRCLHSHAGATVAAYAAELRKLPREAACFVAARDGAQLVGVAGAEFDTDTGRAWLRGPFVAADRAFLPLAQMLLDALIAALPPMLQRFDAFVDAGCAEALAFYGAHGYQSDAGDDELHFDLTGRGSAELPTVVPPGVKLRAPQPAWRAPIAALHLAEFPDPYLSAARLLGRQPPDRLTRIALVDGVPAGYIHAHFDAEWHEGYVDFVAVQPAVRRRGVARALVAAAVAWSRRRHRARGVTLTVRADRGGARALYESMGFVRVRTGVGLRWQRAAEPARA